MKQDRNTIRYPQHIYRFADQDRDGIIDINEFSELWKLIGRQGYRISNYQADSEDR